MGIDDTPEIEQREGPTGTLNEPAVLDPFKKYNLVMAAGECRFFLMKLPEQWFWKLTVTATNRSEKKNGRLVAKILPSRPAWSPLASFNSEKEFNLGRESVQAVIGVGNKGPTRMVLLQLCQEGALLRVRLEGQVFAISTPANGPFQNDNMPE